MKSEWFYRTSAGLGMGIIIGCGVLVIGAPTWAAYGIGFLTFNTILWSNQ